MGKRTKAPVEAPQNIKLQDGSFVRLETALTDPVVAGKVADLVGLARIKRQVTKLATSK